MKKRETLKKHTIMLAEGDYERLQEIYERNTALVVRKLIQKHLEEVDRKVEEAAPVQLEAQL